jgi:hypothetical protein
MKIQVELLAFDFERKFREVTIPDGQVTEPVKALLDQVFYWGQNDFQPQPCYSVSVGDVIHLPSGKWLVQSVGFLELSEEKYQDYKTRSPQGRRLMIWGS